MKIYKISQVAPQQPNTQSDPNSPQNVEATEAIQKLLACVQTINESFQILQQYDITKLLKKETLISEMQSGNLQALDQTKIQTSIEAMSKIAVMIPTYNAAMKTLRDSGANISTIQNQMVALIQQGATVQTNALSLFQNALPSQSGIQMPSNLST
jgi:hypothetical protein